MLLASTVAMSVFAAPLQAYCEQAARQLLDRDAYARAVLGPQGMATDTARPYLFNPPAAPAPVPGVRR